ncbi:MAG: DUF433 domain-containing protein [bacterium]|nr:DUF433 domain-containing protein [bacterium]
MERNQLLERIAMNPKVMGGKPVIKGTRLTVQYILKLMADGLSFTDIKKEYNGITNEDLTACILYASEIMENIEFFPLQEAV